VPRASDHPGAGATNARGDARTSPYRRRGGVTVLACTRSVEARGAFEYPMEGDPQLASVSRHGCGLGLLLALSLALACATPTRDSTPERRFDFARDTFDYTNVNRWLYEFAPGPEGATVKHKLSHAEQTQRCTVMSRTARQFFYAARFEPGAPRASQDEYREMIREVIEFDPRSDQPANEPVTIPGFADLRALSAEHETLLRDVIRGGSLGYRQRGNWRLIFAFSPDHQRGIARGLVGDLERGHPPLVHIANFPKIDINHTALVIGVEETPVELRFQVYDPNDTDGPVRLVFDRATATFHYAQTEYFRGGPTKVWEIYDGAWF
jgi:hypothetical protein